MGGWGVRVEARKALFFRLLPCLYLSFLPCLFL